MTASTPSSWTATSTRSPCTRSPAAVGARPRDSDDVTINDSTAYTVKVRRKQRSVTASVGSAGSTYNSTSDFGTGQSGFYSDKTSVTLDDVAFYDGTSRDRETPRISGLARLGRLASRGAADG